MSGEPLDELEAMRLDAKNLEARLEAAALAIATLTAENESLKSELEEIGYDYPTVDPEVEPPICRVCLHTIRHEPICNDCARKMCRQCGGTDHLACISVKDHPTQTWTLQPMRCAGCGTDEGFIGQRDGKFFCEKC